ncbi:unnamed protein product [Amoebophrya sp. A25]|nr:unnamed protein product [Amoebophrya sp. A25]|eukprot:GSA25T00000382001.1
MNAVLQAVASVPGVARINWLEWAEGDIHSKSWYLRKIFGSMKGQIEGDISQNLLGEFSDKVMADDSEQPQKDAAEFFQNMMRPADDGSLGAHFGADDGSLRAHLATIFEHGHVFEESFAADSSAERPSQEALDSPEPNQLITAKLQDKYLVTQLMFPPGLAPGTALNFQDVLSHNLEKWEEVDGGVVEGSQWRRERLAPMAIDGAGVMGEGLVFQLVRFHTPPHKLQNEVSNIKRTDLNLRSYISKANGEEIDVPLYDLFAVVYHQGTSLGSGHYFTACRVGGVDDWYVFNDKAVSKLPEHNRNNLHLQVDGGDPYLLFYAKNGSKAPAEN